MLVATVVHVFKSEETCHATTASVPARGAGSVAVSAVAPAFRCTPVSDEITPSFAAGFRSR
ncbi:hypothetical protein CMV30_07530 [Nibricoccus aquaticus]|uniref:Uncharacterized protein n=1 Tax=Nibricoccus aquaticus TaxID=2576891 RepID=A0A290Q9D2_9BACT|nr:hypothetical protein CMV30_07530 [Nibricoccus aquaticus]